MAGQVLSAARSWLAAWVQALTADPPATRSIQIPSTGPSPLLELVAASPLSAARAAASASVVSDLPSGGAAAASPEGGDTVWEGQDFNHHIICYQRYLTGFTGVNATRTACVSGVSPSRYQRYSANISTASSPSARDMIHSSDRVAIY